MAAVAGPVSYLPLLALYHAGTASASQNGTQHRIVGWQANPSRRGTLNIIENCVFTILTCTWSIQHPNLPAGDDTPRIRLKRQLKWTFLNIIAPEFLLAQAIGHYLWARATKKCLDIKLGKSKKKGWSAWWDRFVRLCLFPRRWWRDFNSPPDLEPGDWTLKHIHYGNMGGLVVSVDPNGIPDTEGSSDAVEKSADEAESSKAAGESGSSGGSGRRSLNSDDEIWKAAVTTDQYLQYMMDKGHADGPDKDSFPPKPPPLAKAEIEDKDKESIFTKVIAIIQITSLSLSLLTRKINNLSTTQFEIITLAFGACALLTSLAQWSKPQQVVVATQIRYQIGVEIPTNPPPRFYHIMTHPRKSPGVKTRDRFKNDSVSPSQSPPWDVLTLLVIAMVGIGAVHLLAWNFIFPTPAEKIIWRTASLASIILPGVLLFIAWVLPPTIAVLADFKPSRSKQDDRRRFMTALLSAGSNLGSDKLEDPLIKLFIALHTPFGADLSYRDIFTNDHIQELERLGDHVRNDPHYAPHYPEFKDDFAELLRLVRIVDPDEISLERAKVDVFPPRSRTEKINRYRKVLFRVFSPVVGILYAVSRICIIAVALSSFRAMPDSVYITLWTKYIPDIQ